MVNPIADEQNLEGGQSGLLLLLEYIYPLMANCASALVSQTSTSSGQNVGSFSVTVLLTPGLVAAPDVVSSSLDMLKQKRKEPGITVFKPTQSLNCEKHKEFEKSKND